MSNNTKQFLAFGECMLELMPSGQAANNMQLSYAGDTYNVAYYLAQYAPKNSVSYLTALGDDPYSLAMQQHFKAQGIQTQHIVTIPHALPGLYLIYNDEHKERYMYYYRQHAAVKQIFDEAYYQTATKNLKQIDFFYFSSISIAVLPEAKRQVFLQLVQQLKQQGITIIFDSNYRPRLWQSPEQARQTVEQFLPYVDIALPTFSDDALLFSDPDYKQCAERYLQHGVGEVVVKRDIQPTLLATSEGMTEIAVNATDNLVDTTCAGDSFNGGFLAARLYHQKSASDAVRCGQQLAATVIQHRGAIIAPTYLPELFIG